MKSTFSFNALRVDGFDWGALSRRLALLALCVLWSCVKRVMSRAADTHEHHHFSTFAERLRRGDPAQQSQPFRRGPESQWS
jgi:hypothetical protein